MISDKTENTDQQERIVKNIQHFLENDEEMRNLVDFIFDEVGNDQTKLNLEEIGEMVEELSQLVHGGPILQTHVIEKIFEESLFKSSQIKPRHKKDTISSKTPIPNPKIVICSIPTS